MLKLFSPVDQEQVRWICQNLNLEQVELVDGSLTELPALDGLFWFGSADLFSSKSYSLYVSQARALGKLVVGVAIRFVLLGEEEEREVLAEHESTIFDLREGLLRKIESFRQPRVNERAKPSQPPPFPTAKAEPPSPEECASLNEAESAELEVWKNKVTKMLFGYEGEPISVDCTFLKKRVKKALVEFFRKKWDVKEGSDCREQWLTFEPAQNLRSYEPTRSG